MGCDIHGHVEIKVEGEWLYYSPTRIRRNYCAFARMANVRNFYKEKIEPMTLPRGLPEDVTPMTKIHSEYWGEDGHSHSWLSHPEIVELIDWLQENYPIEGRNYTWSFLGDSFYLFGSGIYHWQIYLEDYPNFIQDIRLVFWFDN